MINNDLTTKLIEFSKKSLEIINDDKRKGRLRKKENIYTKAKITSFDYNDGNIKVSYKPIEEKTEEWSEPEIIWYIVKRRSTLPDYSKIVSQISNNLKINKEETEKKLDFLLIDLTMTDDLTEGDIAYRIKLFIDDLVGNPIEWGTKVWITGIKLDKDEYIIDKNLKIRKPEPSDIEDEIFGGTKRYENDFKEITKLVERRSFASAVLEFTFTTTYPKEVQIEKRKLLDILRLFKMGSIRVIDYVIEPKNSILRYEVFPYLSFLYVLEIYSYSIHDSDVSVLELLIKNLRSKLPDKLNTEAAEKEPTNMALKRYKEALLKRNSTENRITHSVIGLESLYLSGDEMSELAYKFRQRIALILELCGFDSTQTIKNLKLAYGIRSRYVHGSVHNHSQAVLEELKKTILDYTRLSILIFLQLKSVINKEDLIKLIDEAMLNENKRAELKDFLIKNCIISL